jgi:hypothetical protein
VLGMAILAVVLLRHVRTGSEPEDQADTEPGGAVAGDVGVEKALGPPPQRRRNRAPRIEEP